MSQEKQLPKQRHQPPRGYGCTVVDRPSPSDLLGVGGFPDWYPGQYELLEKGLDWYFSDNSCLGVSAPTGTGKTLFALLMSHLSGARTVILTATKGLSEQYMRDAAALGAVEVKGQNNFSCPLVPGIRADEGPCHDGTPCPMRDECPYRAQLLRAQGAQIVVTNYAYWMAQTNFSTGLGDVGLLVLDEGHQAFGAIENHMALHLSRMDIQSLGLNFPDGDWEVWRTWAQECVPTAEEHVDKIEGGIKKYRSLGQPVPGHISRTYRGAKSLLAKLESLSDLNDTWILQQTKHGYKFTPKWVAPHTDKLLSGVPKTIILSAVLSAKTLDYLGIDSQREFVSVPSYFPPENTQIWHVPTARINYRTDDYGSTLWCTRVDQIIQRRLDRKGIIFTVSYDRARMLLLRSRFREIMVTHDTYDVVQVVDKFKKMPAPAVLVSPSVTTGWDFPANRTGIKYAIVGKVAYPDTKDEVTRSRHEEDKDWTSYLAMETIVQECGRLNRGPEDKAELLIIDDNWLWFYKQYRKFAPDYFCQRVRGSQKTVPDPLVD